MIKIIEPGTKKIAVCDDCGCKFSFEKEDVQFRGHDPLRPNWYQHFVLCPQCHKEKILEQTR